MDNVRKNELTAIRVADYIAEVLKELGHSDAIPRVVSEIRGIMSGEDKKLLSLIDDLMITCNHGHPITFWNNGVQFDFDVSLADFDIVSDTEGFVPIVNANVVSTTSFGPAFMNMFQSDALNNWTHDFLIETCLESRVFQEISEAANRLAQHVVKMGYQYEDVVPMIQQRLDTIN